jgi:TonB family protein
MKRNSVVCRFSRSPVFLCAVILLIAPALSSLACHSKKQPLAESDEIQDAVMQGDLAKIKALLKENTDSVSNKDFEGATLLHRAASAGRKDAVELLLSHRADANARDNNGVTALHYAAAAGHKDAAESLLAHRADVNARDNSTGGTPLHWAGHKDVAELLLANKANVHARDNSGQTPLHWASKHDHRKVVELLLANKAEVNAKDNNGYTPLHLAEMEGNKSVEEFLRRNDGIEGEKPGGGSLPEPTYALGDGVKAPRDIARPMAPYTEEARKARIEGIVVLQAVIRKNGTVDSFRIIKGLGYGLDESAINTIAVKWRFEPATLKGVPVDVQANIKMLFRIY